MGTTRSEESNPSVGRSPGPCPGALLPDWYETWTAEEAAQELSGFEFEGAGWYIRPDGSVLLAAPLDKRADGRELFRFFIWGAGFIDTLAWLKSAPTHFPKN